MSRRGPNRIKPNPGGLLLWLKGEGTLRARPDGEMKGRGLGEASAVEVLCP